MGLKDKFSLYKIRYKRWRAKTGSPEWHELTAMLRSYAGDERGAWIHSFFASVKRAVRMLQEWGQEFTKQFEGLALSDSV